MGDKHKKKMDIANTTRCYRQSKRFDLFSGQWEAKRFENHRKRVENIAPRIDAHAPKSTALQHVKVCIKCKYVVLLKNNFKIRVYNSSMYFIYVDTVSPQIGRTSVPKKSRPI